VGEYTTAAVRCFSGLPGPIPLDTNIGRVLARWVHGAAHLRDLPRSALAATAEAVALSGTPRDDALALMDLGALVCTARSPVCSSCPLRGECRWQQNGRPPGERRPVAAPKFETTARWARGRIVEMLRQQPHAEPALARALPPAHAQSLAEYLGALHGDGLIEQDGAAWRLAGDQAMNMASPKL
jgi:A/G-specific adenine glycosylase